MVLLSTRVPLSKSMSQKSSSKLENHLERVAYHEAGHALLFSCFGRPVDSITIHPDFSGETNKEHLEFDEENPDLPVLVRCQQTAIAVAGCISEGKYIEGDPLILLYGGGLDDLTHIQRVQVPKETMFELIDHFVTPIINNHWDKIDHLSKELIKHRKLQKDCISRCFDNLHSPSKYNQRLEELIGPA